MILYFSGTGNSAYAAERIGQEVKDEIVDLFDKIKDHDFSEMKSARPWVMVVPTYAWRIPRIVQQWLEKTKLTGSRDIYFVMTCGESIGNAGKYLEKLCSRKKLYNYGCFEIVMPENYIAMFSAPSRQRALEIIEEAETAIDRAAMLIKSGKRFPERKAAFRDRISSGIVNSVFYPVFVHAKKFYAVDTCISCGECVKVCPLGNISLKEGKPVWEDNCTHCMACICRCPSEAIEYGKHSRGLVRYTCPKHI